MLIWAGTQLRSHHQGLIGKQMVALITGFLVALIKPTRGQQPSSLTAVQHPTPKHQPLTMIDC